MGYNPPPPYPMTRNPVPPPPYPMTRNPVPPPPPPPPPKRTINEGWPSITKPKKKQKKNVEPKIELITRDYDGAQFAKCSDADGYEMIPLGKQGKFTGVDAQMMKKLVDVRDKHGKIRMDVRIDEEGFPIVKIENPDEDGYLAVKLPKDVDHKDINDLASKYYSGYSAVSSINENYLATIRVDNAVKQYAEKVHGKVKMSKDGLIQIEGSIENNKDLVDKLWFPPNRLINESTGEVTYDYVSEEQKRQWPEPMSKKDADRLKKKQKEIVKPEPKSEYGEAISIRKKKSRWERFIDRIIKNIVWGK